MENRALAAALQKLAHARHDEEAWEVLYRGLRPLAFAIAYRLLGGSQELAREATQEIFFRLVKYCPFGDLTKPEKFRAYLGTVARNVASRMRREGGIYREAELGVLAGSDSDLSEPVQTHLGEVIELRQLLKRAIHELAAEDRKVFSLRLEGYSLKEIGKLTGASAGAVAVRLHRIRSRLQANPLLRELV